MRWYSSATLAHSFSLMACLYLSNVPSIWLALSTLPVTNDLWLFELHIGIALSSILSLRGSENYSLSLSASAVIHLNPIWLFLSNSCSWLKMSVDVGKCYTTNLLQRWLLAKDNWIAYSLMTDPRSLCFEHILEVIKNQSDRLIVMIYLWIWKVHYRAKLMSSLPVACYLCILVQNNNHSP